MELRGLELDVIDDDPCVDDELLSLEVEFDEDEEEDVVVNVKSSGKQFAGVPHKFNIAYMLSMFMLFPEALEKEFA